MESSVAPARRPPSSLVLVGFVLTAFAAGAIGAALQGDAVGPRYLALTRPDWAPPQEAFGIVWPVLYLLIGIAGWRIWRTTEQRRGRMVLGLWAGQLVVNAVWPWVFFGLEAFGAAVAVIVVLDALVVATVLGAWRSDRIAAALLLPYLGWIVYATALNIAIWQLN